MATSSFSKYFVVTDQCSIEQFKRDLDNPRHIVVKKRDYKADEQKSIALIKQRLLNLH